MSDLTNEITPASSGAEGSRPGSAKAGCDKESEGFAYDAPRTLEEIRSAIALIRLLQFKRLISVKDAQFQVSALKAEAEILKARGQDEPVQADAARIDAVFDKHPDLLKSLLPGLKPEIVQDLLRRLRGWER
ncbi:MAG: hypothetical protein HY291_21940 [Planctomycetes bacterium]|nr:hypothetical protein [Planctomycetota bacterium]